MNKKILFSLIIVCVLVFPGMSASAQENNSVKDFLEQVLPSQPGRKIVLNSATGMLTVTDTPSNHKLIRELLEKWDVGPRQIMIEARFVEVTEEALLELGVEWLYRHSDTGPGGSEDTNRRLKDSTYYIGPADSSGDGAAVTDWFWTPADFGEGNYPFLHDMPGFSGTQFGAPEETSGLGLWIGKTTTQGSQLYMYLRGLEGSDKATLLSAPSVTTLSGQMANIELAMTAPYASEVNLTDTGSRSFGQYQTYEVEEKKTGVFLEVTPSVAEGGNIITLDLHPEVSEVTRKVSLSDSEQFPEYLGWPIIDSRSSQTTVVVRSGQTIVMGGLMKDKEVNVERRVPVLGSIPILGNLFKYKHESRKKTNLIIFLKATIIDAEGKEVK